MVDLQSLQQIDFLQDWSCLAIDSIYDSIDQTRLQTQDLVKLGLKTILIGNPGIIFTSK